MSETIVGAFIGGICAIIGAIISPIITYKLNNFSKIHRISKNNTKTNEVTRHDIDKNRTRKNNLYIKRFLVVITYIILFLLGIIIYIILFQLSPKTSENDLLNDKIIYLNSEIDWLNNELSTYKKQIDSSDFIELKKRLSNDAVYSIILLQEAEFDDQKDLLYLYHTFIQLLYELENKDDIDINRLIESMERAEKTLENYK